MAFIEINVVAALLRVRCVWNFSVWLTLVMIVGSGQLPAADPVPTTDGGSKVTQAKDLNIAAAKPRVELAVRVLEGTMSEVMALTGYKSPFPGSDLTGGAYMYRGGSIDSSLLHYPPPIPAGVYELRFLFTEKQFALAWSAMERKKELKPASLPNMTVQSGTEAVFDQLATLGGKQIKVTPKIDPDDGRVIEITILPPSLNSKKPPSYTTSVSIWNGQTLMLGSEPAGKTDVSNFIFVSAWVIDANGERVKR